MRSLKELGETLSQAAAAYARGDWRHASELCLLILRENPNEPNALLLLGSVRGRSGDAESAVSLLERARTSAPRNIHVLNALGAAYRARNLPQNAKIVLQQAIDIDGRFDSALVNLAHVMFDLEDKDGAKLAYERALAIAPDTPEAIAGLAAIAEREHRLDDAQDLARRALAIEPGDIQANLTLARVSLRRRDFKGARVTIEVFKAYPDLSPSDRIAIEECHAEALEGLADYDHAFSAFETVNNLTAAMLDRRVKSVEGPFSPNTIVRLTEFVGRCEPGTWTEAGVPYPQAPAFLVGFPRSGTTLLDQILASHPSVTTLEERDNLSDSYGLMIMESGALEGWSRRSPEDMEAMRSKYWLRVGAGLRGNPSRPIFVDKQPLNAVMLPLIYRLFPGAKIILALRDPRDAVMSCFKQRFVANTAMSQFLNLGSAAAYYDAVMNLVQVTRERLPLSVHEIRYEEVIEDFDQAIEALLAFLGLPWNDQVREYAATAKKREIRTPSALQVVRPLYTSSRGSWRNYERHLQPHLPVLDPWVRKFGYEK